MLTPIQIGLTLNARAMIILIVVLCLALFGFWTAMTLVAKAIRQSFGKRTQSKAW